MGFRLCKRCGLLISPSDKICPRCNAPVTETNTEAETQSSPLNWGSMSFFSFGDNDDLENTIHASLSPEGQSGSTQVRQDGGGMDMSQPAAADKTTDYPKWNQNTSNITQPTMNTSQSNTDISQQYANGSSSAASESTQSVTYDQDEWNRWMSRNISMMEGIRNKSDSDK